MKATEQYFPVVLFIMLFKVMFGTICYIIILSLVGRIRYHLNSILEGKKQVRARCRKPEISDNGM